MTAPTAAYTLRQTTLHLREWSIHLLADFYEAQQSIHLAAHSMQIPVGTAKTSWQATWSALIEAAATGKTVCLYLSAPLLSHPATLNNTSSATKAHRAGIQCRLLKPPNVLHAKCAVIDDQITWIGSGNMTSAAHHHNREVWLRSTDTKIAQELRSWLEIQE